SGLEDREHGSHPVQIALGHDAHDRFASQPPRQKGSCQLIGASIELSVSPLSVAVYSRDGLWMRPRSFLEQLVSAAVGQISTPSGETIKLETQLLSGEQALSCVLGIWIGRDQRQRGEVVAGDPVGAVCVEH